MSRRTKRIPLGEKFKDCSVQSVLLQELDGTDELASIERLVSPEDGTMRAKGGIAQTMVRNSMIAEAIIQVDDLDVIRPFNDWTKWNLKTRDFVTRAFNRMNGASDKELEDFDEAVFGDAPASGHGDSGSSQTGSGSRGTSKEGSATPSG